MPRKKIEKNPENVMKNFVTYELNRDIENIKNIPLEQRELALKAPSLTTNRLLELMLMEMGAFGLSRIHNRIEHYTEWLMKELKEKKLEVIANEAQPMPQQASRRECEMLYV